MNNQSGIFGDLTHVAKARNGRLSSWDQRGKNQDYWQIPPARPSAWAKWRGPAALLISG